MENVWGRIDKTFSNLIKIICPFKREDFIDFFSILENDIKNKKIRCCALWEKHVTMVY